jgi:hypothetical protein
LHVRRVYEADPNYKRRRLQGAAAFSRKLKSIVA